MIVSSNLLAQRSPHRVSQPQCRCEPRGADRFGQRHAREATLPLRPPPGQVICGSSVEQRSGFRPHHGRAALRPTGPVGGLPRAERPAIAARSQHRISGHA